MRKNPAVAPPGPARRRGDDVEVHIADDRYIHIGIAAPAAGTAGSDAGKERFPVAKPAANRFTQPPISL